MARKNRFFNWREDLHEYLGTNTSIADRNQAVPAKAKTDTKAQKKIDTAKVNNKIVINPPMKEAFEEIGGTLLEVVEIDEEGKLGHLQQKRAMVDMKIAKERVKMAKKAKKSGEDVVTEKMDMKKADMGDVVKDFYKSDAPQFKGKSKTKRREMAIAAKLQADEDEN